MLSILMGLSTIYCQMKTPKNKERVRKGSKCCHWQFGYYPVFTASRARPQFILKKTCGIKIL